MACLLGEACLRLSEMSTALRHLEASLALAREADDGPLAAEVLARLGRVHLDTGNFERAQACLALQATDTKP